jgi:hypothetical protein
LLLLLAVHQSLAGALLRLAAASPCLQKGNAECSSA